jgi:hypothetical protein
MFMFESDTRQVPMNCRTRRNHLTPPPQLVVPSAWFVISH